MPSNLALQAATLRAAALVSNSQWPLMAGQITPGYLADIVATRSNPVEDIYNIRASEVMFVMKDGEIFKNEEA